MLPYSALLAKTALSYSAKFFVNMTIEAIISIQWRTYNVK